MLGDTSMQAPGKAWQLHMAWKGWSATATGSADFLLSMNAHSHKHIFLMVDDVSAADCRGT